MEKTEFVYVTYIAATAEQVWKALTEPEITTKYWQHVNVSDWKPGSRWEHRDSGIKGKVLMLGKVLESAPPRRLVITWADPADEKNEAKQTRVTFAIEDVRGIVKLTVTHDQLDVDSAMLKGITDGWPKVLSRLKTLLEGGKSIPTLW